jgi:hypothetical protein
MADESGLPPTPKLGDPLAGLPSDPPPAPPPPAAAPGYGAGPPAPGGYYGPRQGNTSAILALILGIVGIVVLPLVAPFAWWQGVVGKRNVDRGLTTENRGLAVAGQVMGIIGTVLLVIYILAIVALIIVGVSSS